MSQILQQALASKRGQISRLVKQAQQLEQLDRLFHQILHSELSSHCQIAKFEKNQLTVIVDNATWATNLRFQLPDLIKQLRTQPEFNKLKSIRYRVSPKTSTEQSSPKPKQTLSTKNANLIQELAASITNEELKNNLKKLATRAINQQQLEPDAE